MVRVMKERHLVSSTLGSIVEMRAFSLEGEEGRSEQDQVQVLEKSRLTCF